MYKNFFGFKERPFKLVPNPAYLFLSRSHEEALAHLTYAMIQGDGFVEITGEVGTGKTTLCRAFLEDLNSHTNAAYIFNPKLNAIQLLKAINDEFEINSAADNTKDLIDTLNAFLIEQKAQGKNSILVIDEAQNLTEEVLEQLRLLSNLETTKHKLLQIILVGQPELGEKLDSHELRQLGQRITLSCQLVPLTYKEVREYIQHRINIASRKPGVKFSNAAYRAIYQYSQGIPRLINIVCDRALLTAFSLDRKVITGKITKASMRELAGRGDIKQYSLREGKRVILLLSILGLILLVTVFYRTWFPAVYEIFNPAERQQPKTTQLEKPDLHPPENPVVVSQPNTAQSVLVKEPVMPTDRSLKDFLAAKDRRSSRHSSLKTALDMWNPRSVIQPELNGVDDDQTFFRLAAKQNGLFLRRIQGDLSLITQLNLPAILAFYQPEGPSPIYLTLTNIDSKRIALKSDEQDQVIEVHPDELASYWSGVAYILWKNFLSLSGTIPLNATTDSIITLKLLLRDIGFKEIEITPFYDSRTRQAIEAIQKKHAIRVDGIVGSTTKIVLYNEKKFLEIPHITQ